MKTDFTDDDINDLVLEWEIPRFIFNTALFHSPLMWRIIELITVKDKPVELIQEIQNILDMMIQDKYKQILIWELLKLWNMKMQ